MVFSIQVGQSSTAANPILDFFTAFGDPLVPTDVAVLQFRIYDVSTDAKKLVPLQVYPVAVGTWQDVDPTAAPPAGVRLGVGHYFAPWTVPLNEALGDHRIDWRWKRTTNASFETASVTFYVYPDMGSGPDPSQYCSVADVRAEGFTDPTLYPDGRIISLINLASRYIDKMTGRWFFPKEFPLATPPVGFVKTVNLLPGVQYPIPTQINLQAGDNPLMIDGQGRRNLVTCELDIPICRLDFLGFENQAFTFSQLTWLELASVRVYNRHLRGMLQPDDRENPRIGFTVAGRIVETIATGLYPAPRIFPNGRMNVFLFGAFGYTDPDPAGVIPEGITPAMIRQVAVRLVLRDIIPEGRRAKKLAFRDMYRIIQDHEGQTSIGLQQLWLKGKFTGDPDIDPVLTSYQRPPRLGIA